MAVDDKKLQNTNAITCGKFLIVVKQNIKLRLCMVTNLEASGMELVLYDDKNLNSKTAICRIVLQEELNQIMLVQFVHNWICHH